MKLLVNSKRFKKCFFAIEGQIVAINLCTATTTSIGQTYECGNSAGSNVHVLAIDSEEKYLVAAFENKTLACWNIASGELVGSRQLRKKPTGAQIGTWDCDGIVRSVVIVSDKAGDIWAVRMPDLASESLVAGHTASVVTDLAITSDYKHIISVDRDEKLRISSFPDLETIENYGLYHNSVVSSVDTIVDSSGRHLIVSTGWDHKLLLWDLVSAQVVDEVSFREETNDNNKSSNNQVGSSSSKAAANADGDDMIPEKDYNEKDAGNYPFQVVSNNTDSIAVIFKDESKVHVYKINEAKFQLVEIVALPAHPLDVQFIDSTTLFVLLPKEHMIAVYDVNSKSLQQATGFLDSSSLEMLQAKAGENFNQSIISKGLGFDGETGMKKHALDRPFNEEEHINFNAKKGAKRSKKSEST